MKLTKDKISLIIANLLPIVGVAFFDWSLFNFLFLYWLESAVIGFYFILKTIKIARVRRGTVGAMLAGQCIFFFFHYGGFMLGHLMFIFFISQRYQSVMSFSWSGLFFLFLNLATLFISHGISYKQNFIGKREYEKFFSVFLFWGPYDRIVVMHIVVLLGSTLVLGKGWPLYTIVIIKLIVDYWVHTKYHKTNAKLNQVEKAFEQIANNPDSGNIIAVNPNDNKKYTETLNDWTKKQ